MKIRLIILLVFYHLFVFGQEKYDINPASDIYGLNVEFKKLIYSGKCDCCSRINKSKICNLYEIEIYEILLQRDTTVFNSKEKLSKIKHVVINSNSEIMLDKKYFIFAGNSCSDKFLNINQILLTQPEPIPQYEGLAYFQGLGVCKKYNWIQKLFLRLNINSDKIHRKAKTKPSNCSKFVKIITR